jgi:hypothetical protein
MSERLHPDDLERLAVLVAERLAEHLASATLPAAPSLIDAAEVARRFGVDRSWVYDHADELSAVRLGGGARPRLRFDVETVGAALTARRTSEQSPAPEMPAAVRRRDAGVGDLPPLVPNCCPYGGSNRRMRDATHNKVGRRRANDPPPAPEVRTPARRARYRPSDRVRPLASVAGALTEGGHHHG